MPTPVKRLVQVQPYYQTDRVTLYHGDYTTILPTLPTGSVNVVVTDPPFGINYQNNYTHSKYDRIANDGSKFSYFTLATQCFRLLKSDSAVFVYTGWSEYPHHFSNVKDAGFDVKEPLIVQKRQSGTSDLYGSLQSNSDWIIFATKGRFKFKPTQLLRNKRAGVIPNKGRNPVPEFKTRFPSCWFGDSYPWSTENPATNPEHRHPTKKTVELMSWLIAMTTNPNDTVLDPFAGSGTTLIAAQQTGRKVIGVEISQNYCDLIVSRLKVTTGVYPSLIGYEI